LRLELQKWEHQILKQQHQQRQGYPARRGEPPIVPGRGYNHMDGGDPRAGRYAEAPNHAQSQLSDYDMQAWEAWLGGSSQHMASHCIAR
jgi:hypothetical protein